MSQWAADSVFYHIYPLGLCGAPERNDFETPPEPRLNRLHDWIGHLRRLGVDALYLGPLFESTAHGYDTADFFQVDRRLGDNESLVQLVDALHDAGIRVVLDGVFHHVGRDFWAFRDLQKHGPESDYRDWFVGVDFDRQSPHGDPFAYEGWRGHYDLVKLDLHHPAVREHLFDAVSTWIHDFGIDGLRLDVAEDIELSFLRDLAAFCRNERDDFWLMGEVIHGDYRRWLHEAELDAVTNYELYKGLYSSHNDRNYYELAHSLDRQFGDPGIYRGETLYTFADNHDVTRVASILDDPAHLYPLHVLLFTVPGAPSIYYGSEWGVEGVKTEGTDWPLRPSIEAPGAAHDAPHAALADFIARLAQIRHDSQALRHGSYRRLHVDSEQLAFVREVDSERVVVAVNASSQPARIDVESPLPDGTTWTDLLDQDASFTTHDGRLTLDAVPANGGRILTSAFNLIDG